MNKTGPTDHPHHHGPYPHDITHSSRTNIQSLPACFFGYFLGANFQHHVFLVANLLTEESAIPQLHVSACRLT